MKTCEGVICEVLFFYNFVCCSNMSNNDTSKGVTGGIDMKFIIEALTSEVKRIVMLQKYSRIFIIILLYIFRV